MDIIDNFFNAPKSSVNVSMGESYNPLDENSDVRKTSNKQFEKTKLGYKYIINSKYVESILTYDVIYNIKNLSKESLKYIDPEDHRRNMVIKFKDLSAYQVNKILRMCYKIPLKILEPVDVKIIRLVISPESTDKYNVIADGDLLIRHKICQIPINQNIPEETQFMFNSDKLIKNNNETQKNSVEQLKIVDVVLNEDLEPPSSLQIIPYNRKAQLTSLKSKTQLVGKAVVKKIYPSENNYSMNRINRFERQGDNIILIETRLNDSPVKLLFDTMTYYGDDNVEDSNEEKLEKEIIEDLKNAFSEDFVYPKVIMSEDYRNVHKLL